MGNFTNKSARTFFEEICGIQRDATKEQKILDYLINFAETRSLRFVRSNFVNNNYDQIESSIFGFNGNLVIYKNTLSNEKPIALQTCVDSLVLDDTEDDENIVQILKRGAYYESQKKNMGAVSAGAIAVILELLDSDIPVNVEAVFTTRGNLDMAGAREFDESIISSRKMICFCQEKMGSLVTSSASASELFASFDNEKIFLENTVKFKTFKLIIEKNQIENFSTLRFFSSIMDKIKDVKINKLEVNPFKIECVFSTEISIEELKNTIKYFFLKAKEKNRKFKMRCTREINQTLVIMHSDLLLNMIERIENLLFSHRNDLKQETAFLSTVTGKMRVDIFSHNETEIERQIERIRGCENEFSFKLENIISFPRVLTSENDEFFIEVKNAYVGLNEMKIKNTYKALEGGFFQNKISNLEIVTLAFQVENIDTPNEKMLIPSLVNVSLWVKNFFEQLNQNKLKNTKKTIDEK